MYKLRVYSASYFYIVITSIYLYNIYNSMDLGFTPIRGIGY